MSIVRINLAQHGEVLRKPVQRAAIRKVWLVVGHRSAWNRPTATYMDGPDVFYVSYRSALQAAERNRKAGTTMYVFEAPALVFDLGPNRIVIVMGFYHENWNVFRVAGFEEWSLPEKWKDQSREFSGMDVMDLFEEATAGRPVSGWATKYAPPNYVTLSDAVELESPGKDHGYCSTRLISMEFGLEQYHPSVLPIDISSLKKILRALKPLCSGPAKPVRITVEAAAQQIEVPLDILKYELSRLGLGTTMRLVDQDIVDQIREARRRRE